MCCLMPRLSPWVIHTFRTETLEAHGVTEEKNSLYFSETITIEVFVVFLLNYLI